MTEQEREKALQIIQRQYESFINLQGNWEFFRGVADYAKTIEALVPTRQIASTLEQQRLLAERAQEMLGTKAFKEMTEAARRMTATATKAAKQMAPALETIEAIQEQLSGRVLTENQLAYLNENMQRTARILKESGAVETLRQIQGSVVVPSPVPDYTVFSPAYEELEDEKERLQRKDQVEPWGAWRHLPFIRRMIYEPEELMAEVKAECDDNPTLENKWMYMSLVAVMGEFNKLRAGELDDSKASMFKMADYRSIVRRVQRYMETELAKPLEDEQPQPLQFDDEARVLRFAGAEITVSKKAEADPHMLLRTVFKDKAKVWNNDEIKEDWGLRFDEELPSKKIYQAGKAVNEKVAQETRVKDFLLVSTTEIQLNPKYLTG